MGPTPGRRRAVLLLVWLAALVVVVLLWFAGPLLSGGLFLLIPPAPAAEHATSPGDPLHKGYIDLATGLYIREDDDFIVPGDPPLVLRRTYLSRDPYSREFGIGTTHGGEIYLVGDGEQLKWTELILANGARIRFDRVSYGSWMANAMFEYHGPSEFQDARLGWTGLGWAIRRRDGQVMRFMACRPGPKKDCPIVSQRNPSGGHVQYRRTASGQLLRIEAAPDRWIAFEYDDKKRITRAHASTAHEVRYTYDAPGRLIHVRGDDGVERRYAYSDRAEMTEIKDPGRLIENRFDTNGRCIRQITRYVDGTPPFIFDFSYVTDDDRVVQAESRRSDGFVEVYAFKNQYMVSETVSTGVGPLLHVSYERHPATNLVTSLALTCQDRTGQSLRHSSVVEPGQEDRVKEELAARYCFQSGISRPPGQTPPNRERHDLAGTSWQLVKFQSGDGKTLKPDDGRKYTIEFGTDGSLIVRIDCNTGRGSWKSAAPNKVEFGPLALTRAMCPPGSLHNQIVKHWGLIRSYAIKDGHLFLALQADAGSYEFEPIRRATVRSWDNRLRGRTPGPTNAAENRAFSRGRPLAVARAAGMR